MTHETAAVLAQVLCTPYNHTPCHFMQSHMRKVYACLAVACHQHFGQNDRDLLRATAVTRGGTVTEIRVSTKSQPWRKNSPTAPAGIWTHELLLFQSRVLHSNHCPIPAPEFDRFEMAWLLLRCGTSREEIWKLDFLVHLLAPYSVHLIFVFVDFVFLCQQWVKNSYTYSAQ